MASSALKTTAKSLAVYIKIIVIVRIFGNVTILESLIWKSVQMVWNSMKFTGIVIGHHHPPVVMINQAHLNQQVQLKLQVQQN